MRLTWAQPEDLVAHELVQCAAEGKDTADIARRWVAAGGSPIPQAAGASDDSGGLRPLARMLLAELDELGPTDSPDEPNDLADIERIAAGSSKRSAGKDIADRVLGGWLGRAAGCLLGKPVEKIPRAGIREIAEATGNWPVAGYFTERGLPPDIASKWPWNRRSRPTSLLENIDGMPEDDDLNFAILALSLLERHGDALTSDDVAAAWLDNLPAGRVFTAERAAYRNLLDAYPVPLTATTRNPFREWIGAQIRTDVYGWAHPGDPHVAARLAWQDARLSHTRNGIYGAMFVAAACSTACVTDDVEEVIAAGLAVVPPRSRYTAAIEFGAQLGNSGIDSEAALDALHREFGQLHWVHVLNNAALIAYSLTVAGGQFGPAIGIAVTGGWDTDSDGATVGSICGALAGAERLPDEWIAPLRNRIASTVPGFDGIAITDLAKRTLGLIQ